MKLFEMKHIKKSFGALDVLRDISLEVDEGPVRGWCLAAMEGFPLGWAKGTGMSLKNKYYPGWRWQ